MVHFNSLFISLSLSLVSIHAVFLFLLCTEPLEQKQFPPWRSIKHSDSDDSEKQADSP